MSVNHWSLMAARNHSFGFAGAADPTTVAKLIASGLSSIDANFIAAYDPVDKSQLLTMLATGQNPYDALTVLYGGAPYIPNLDTVTLATYRPPNYAPLTVTPVVSTVPLTGTTTAAPTTGFQIPATIFGIPTLWLGLGAGAAILLLREMG